MIEVFSTHDTMRIVKDGAGPTIVRPYLICELRSQVVGVQ